MQISSHTRVHKYQSEISFLTFFNLETQSPNFWYWVVYRLHSMICWLLSLDASSIDLVLCSKNTISPMDLLFTFLCEWTHSFHSKVLFQNYILYTWVIIHV
jgi:hypothetical protein